MIAKRFFDFSLALIGISLLGLIIIISILMASIDTKSYGLFIQKRIGRHAKLFTIFKIKTLNDCSKTTSSFGFFLRNTKIDELPQLVNILNGTMSFVGPRPDMSGYADKLQGNDRVILSIRPGVTGLASLKYRNEEKILKQQENPIHYNDTIIWPDKVRINKWYIENRTIVMDLKIIFHTILLRNFDAERFIEKHWTS